MLLSKIRNSKTAKVLSVFVSFNMLANMIPIPTFALTSGPTTPEVSSFEPVGTSDMVDVFSGDFNYNIPLMDVGGYPINISYNAGIAMDQEASWVGLGWNLNPGVINRDMRGIPDEFNGEDKVENSENRKANSTMGFQVDLSNLGVFGYEIKNLKGSPSFGLGINYNNYTGFFISRSISVGLSSNESAKPKKTASLGLSSDGNGMTVSPNFSYEKVFGSRKKNFNSSIGFAYSAHDGLKSFHLDGNYTVKKKSNVKAKTGANKSYGLDDFGASTYTPTVSSRMQNTSFSGSYSFGGTFYGAECDVSTSVYFSRQELIDNNREIPAYGYANSNAVGNKGNFILDINREKDGEYTPNKPALPLTSFTYDFFSVQGQGLSGQFHMKLSNYGTVSDETNISTTGSFNGGLQAEGGGLTDYGLNVGESFSFSESGKWNNDLTSTYDLKKPSYSPDYEPYYFIESSESSIETDPSHINSINNDGNLYPKINDDNSGFELNARAHLYQNDGTNGNISSPKTTRTNRQIRNQLMYAFSAKEASIYGSMKHIQDYVGSSFEIPD